MDFLLSHYQWLKALHVVSVIAWMAGMLYLPRLFVYHADAAKGSELSETFKIMERRLYKIIMRYAIIAVWLFGLIMFAVNHETLLSSGWFHAKFLLVCVMTWIHHRFGQWLKAFAADENERPARFYRIWNEVPTFILIVVVLLAVAKPF
jgi:putative membrane protein